MGVVLQQSGESPAAARHFAGADTGSKPRGQHGHPVVSTDRKRPRVLLLGGDADFNLGDHAIQLSLCQAMTSACPQLRVTVVSALPPHHIADRQLPGADTVLPRGPRGLPAQIRAAAGHDAVVIGGGGLLQDDDSRIKLPYWALRLLLMRLFNSTLIAVSVGAGPLQRLESRWWARLGARVLGELSVRDHYARQWMEQALGRPVAVVPDPAFMLSPAPSREGERVVRQLGISPSTPLIGVSLRGWYHQRGGFVPHRLRARFGRQRRQGGDAAMALWLTEMEQGLQRLASLFGARLLFMPSYPLAHEGDLEVCRTLAARMVDHTASVAVIRDPRLYKAVCGRLLLMISARMHPLILAAGMGVPIVGLGYNGKFQGLFDMLGITQRVIPLDDFRDQRACAQDLVRMAITAVEEDRDLAVRSSRLAGQTRAAVASMLYGLRTVMEETGT